MGVETLDVVADRGYYDGEEIKACEDAGITVTLPKPMTSGAKAAGRFGKQDFVYIATEDVYRCPAGERLTYRFQSEEDGKTIRRYWTNACQTCALKAQCTTGPNGASHAMGARGGAGESPGPARSRPRADDHAPSDGGASIRHDQGWMGATHFLTRTLPKVATEMALNVLAYNMKRVMTIMGVEGLLKAMRA